MQVHTCIMYMHASYYSMLYSNINTLKISDMTAWKIIKLFQIQYKRKPYFQKLSEAYILVALQYESTLTKLFCGSLFVQNDSE